MGMLGSLRTATLGLVVVLPGMLLTGCTSTDTADPVSKSTDAVPGYCQQMEPELAGLAGTSNTEKAISTDCRSAGPRGGVAADVAAAVGKLTPMLSDAQRALLQQPFNREAAIRWSNLPIRIVPRG